MSKLLTEHRSYGGFMQLLKYTRNWTLLRQQDTLVITLYCANTRGSKLTEDLAVSNLSTIVKNGLKHKKRQIKARPFTNFVLFALTLYKPLPVLLLPVNEFASSK
jgi:hypothetical protein